MPILSPVRFRTAIRTFARGLNNATLVATGKLSRADAVIKLFQTAAAASRGDLTLLQAADRYLRTVEAGQPLRIETVQHLAAEFLIPEQEHELLECILFGGYEARARADSDFREMASKVALSDPAWKFELFKDLFAGVISKSDCKLIQRVIAIGQGEAVFGDWIAGRNDREAKAGLLKQIRELDQFIPLEEYDQRVKHLIKVAEGKIAPPKIDEILAPPVIEVVPAPPPEQTAEYFGQVALLRQAAITALRRLNEVTFAAVVGGTAERFKYTAPDGTPLPQATFPFLPLSRGNIFRLHADELLALKNLYYLTQDHGSALLSTPYFMMTSGATDRKIGEVFEAKGSFGLGKRSVTRAVQALVPVVSNSGRWLRTDKYALNTKPHGHGDFWTLYLERIAQAELAEDMRKFTVVLQGNNPFAAAHLLEFIGLGMMRRAIFGLGSCPREAGADEGSIVLAKTGADYSILNIEYAVMSTFGLSDTADPRTGSSPFPCNLNLLFADNAAVAELIRRDRFPGEITNLRKLQTSYVAGRATQVPGGRGEAQMQGVAEAITAPSPETLPVFVMDAPRGSHPHSHFDAFKYEPGAPRDTVATCRRNYSDRAALRLTLCGIDVKHTTKGDIGDKEIPTTSSVIELTPAFGNRQDIIAGKVRSGSIASDSTLYLSGFHSRVENLELDGDLEIKVENEIGDASAVEKGDPILPDPAKAGKYRINGLKVNNAGREKVLDAQGIWQGYFIEKGHCRILIKGNGELFVEPGTVIEGDFDLTVEAGEKVTLTPKIGGGVGIKRETLAAPSWRYEIGIAADPTKLDLFELKIAEDFPEYHLSSPDRELITLDQLLRIDTIRRQFDAGNLHRIDILERIFRVEGSMLYAVKLSEKGRPQLKVIAGTKKGSATGYVSRADAGFVPESGHKASTLTASPAKIYVDPIDSSKGAAFEGRHYIAVPNQSTGEIIYLIGRFDESSDLKKADAFPAKLARFLRWAGDARITASAKTESRIRNLMNAVSWADLFEQPDKNIFDRQILPQLRS